MLVENGKLIEENMEAEGIDDDMVQMSLREHGIADVKEVKQAVLETDGSISIVPNDQAAARRKVKRRVRFVKRG